MNLQSQEAENPLATMPMDKLMQIAAEGPQSEEERWRDRQMQDVYQDIARLDARLNAMAEIMRRTVPPVPDGKGSAAVGDAAKGDPDLPGRPVPEDIRPAEMFAKRLHEVANDLGIIANDIALGA